jgi:hypothetical protein
MKYGDLLKKIKDAYLIVLKNLPLDQQARQEYLIENTAQDGMCFFASNKRIFFSKDFIEDYTHGCLYLCQTPGNLDYSGAYEAIRRRIERIDEIYEKWKDVDYDEIS